VAGARGPVREPPPFEDLHSVILVLHKLGSFPAASIHFHRSVPPQGFLEAFRPLGWTGSQRRVIPEQAGIARLARVLHHAQTMSYQVRPGCKQPFPRRGPFGKGQAETFSSPWVSDVTVFW